MADDARLIGVWEDVAGRRAIAEPERYGGVGAWVVSVKSVVDLCGVGIVEDVADDDDDNGSQLLRNRDRSNSSHFIYVVSVPCIQYIRLNRLTGSSVYGRHCPQAS